MNRDTPKDGEMEGGVAEVTFSHNDPQILRARGGDPNDPDPKKRPTDPVGLSRSILHVLASYEYVLILSVGRPAETAVTAAYRLADEEVRKRTTGSVLIMRQSEYTAEIGGKRAKGVCTRIHAIPVKYAL